MKKWFLVFGVLIINLRAQFSVPTAPMNIMVRENPKQQTSVHYTFSCQEDQPCLYQLHHGNSVLFYYDGQSHSFFRK